MWQMVIILPHCYRINNRCSMKIFRCAIYVVVAMLSVGCMSFDVGLDDEPSAPDRPTVPLKRRPIVPTTKLPRPRIVESWGCTTSSITMVLMPDVQSVNVEVVDVKSGGVASYIFDTRNIEIFDLPEDNFEVIVEADGEVEVFVTE